MSEGLRYWISDFLMYSARTWYRLVEQYNASLWPAHLVAFLLGVSIIWLVLRPRPGQGRIISAILVLLWAWVAIMWHWRQFATINWPARWFALAFGVEAALLLWIGVLRHALALRKPPGAVGKAGVVILLIAVFGYPILAVVAGRGVRQSEIFGMMPDPTALGTIGVLLLAERRRWLAAIPVVWCLIAGTTLWYLR